MTRTRIRDIRNQELIQAAIRATASRGFATVTMSDIAAEAGAATTSIAYYFGTKDALMEAAMRHLLTLLRSALVARLKQANTPRDRLRAIVAANFDDTLFTRDHCVFWVQFWANAPYVPHLNRLYEINRARVQSHLRQELRLLLPAHRREPFRETLQAYLDGAWLETAQDTATPPDAGKTRARALNVLDILLESAT